MNALSIIVNLVTFTSLVIVVLSMAGGVIVLASYILTEVNKLIIYVMKVWLYLLPPAIIILLIKVFIMFF